MPLIRSIIIGFVVFCTILFMGFLVGAFMHMSFDPHTWAESRRITLVGWTGAIGTIFGLLSVFYVESEY